jgi:hypothetical protein
VASDTARGVGGAKTGRMNWRSTWDSYWGRIAWGSIGLFVVLPFLTRALAGDYALGVYIGTGVAVLWYTVETYYLRQQTTRSTENAWKANQAGLLRYILEDHMATVEDREVVQAWWQKDPINAVAKYEEGMRAIARGSGVGSDLLKLHSSRRRVSQYFLRLRALCEKKMLDLDLVASTLGDEALQVFVLYIDPLDEALRRAEGKPHKTAEREYFVRYLQEFFPETAMRDPWGFRRQGPKTTK